MNAEDKLNAAIQQDGVNTQSHILDELKRHPQYVEQHTGGDVLPQTKGVELWTTKVLKSLPRNTV